MDLVEVLRRVKAGNPPSVRSMKLAREAGLVWIEGQDAASSRLTENGEWQLAGFEDELASCYQTFTRLMVKTAEEGWGVLAIWQDDPQVALSWPESESWTRNQAIRRLKSLAASPDSQGYHLYLIGPGELRIEASVILSTK